VTPKERFHATIDRKSVDRPACWLGIPDKKALPGLYSHFGVQDLDGLKAAVGDDVQNFDLPYDSPEAKEIVLALNFAKERRIGSNEERSLSLPGVFEDAEAPGDFDAFDWPEPEAFIDPRECRRRAEYTPRDTASVAILWSAHFQDACAAFGMETAFIKMLTDPELFRALNDRIVDFYLRANRVLYEAAADRLDAVLIGNDYGSQLGLMVSPAILREYVLPGTRRLVDQAKSYGVKVIHHSCGAVADLIGDIIDIGADCIHPMQALAKGMEPESLARNFGGRVAFCGGVDAQQLLINGSAQEVREAVRRLKRLFPTGLVVSPSHEAILADTKPENIRALFETVREKT